MSLSPDIKRVTRITKAQKSFRQVNNIQENKSISRHQQKSKSNHKNSTCINITQTNNTIIKTKTFTNEIDKHLVNAKIAKDKIFKGLQFVKLIDNFNQQQRCLQHNHVITLYCLNDKRLLCVYCIYGQNKHRAHKLLPPFQHIQYLAKDVYNLQNNFNQFLFSLEDVLTQSKQSTQVFRNIMKSYLSKLQSQYIKKKLLLQQLYEKEKNYIIQTCQSMIQKSQDIYSQFQQIKFNIWQCQARYHLDKRIKLPNMPIQTQIQLKKCNSKILNKKDNPNLSKSPSKVKNKKQNQPITQTKLTSSQNPKHQLSTTSSQNPKHQLSTDSQKDFRQIMCKHVILSHIVQEMKNIQPLKIDEKTAQKKMFNKLQLKLINNTSQLCQKNSPLNRKSSPNYFLKK